MVQSYRGTARATAALLVAFTAACSDAGITNVIPDEPSIPTAPLFAITPPPAQVVIQGTDLGAFANTFIANHTGRALGEFWDNISADNVPANRCNIGSFAAGTMSNNCRNETPGSWLNSGGYDKYWGDGAEFRDPSSFMFSGAYSYNVTLKGAFAGVSSTIGYFTRDITGYHFFPLPAFSARTVNSTTVINTGGANWGFYITNTFNPDLAGCDIANSAQSACSDALGGFNSQLFQQFALFMNPAQTGYLVGIEDNELEVGGVRDSDYNDYIVSVAPIAYEPPPPVANTLGCSPGYWKNHNFPAGYSKSQLFSSTSIGGSTFENAFPGMTLQQVLSQGGGGLAALGRQTVSAYFNAVVYATFEKTPKQVIDAFNTAAPSNKSAMSALQGEFEALTDVNGRTCTNPTGK
ncbi:MAG: hypothetical protein H7Z40_03665 [Phycisphaerae bacterium]|nr:hypothetical protein [Gemmatimonadaceae bacterium]